MADDTGASAQEITDLVGFLPRDITDIQGLPDERKPFPRRTSSLVILQQPASPLCSSEPTAPVTALQHLDTAFASINTLDSTEQWQVSNVYLERYHQSIHDSKNEAAVDFLLRSLCVDELSLGKSDFARRRNGIGGAAQGLPQRNLLLEATAGKLVLLHGHTDDCHYLYRALGNLRAAAVLDHEAGRAARREFHIRITKTTIVVHRKLYEAICSSQNLPSIPCSALKHLRDAINLAGRYITLTTDSWSSGDESGVNDLRDVLAHALAWILELQSSSACTGLSIGLHLLRITRDLPVPLLSKLLQPIPTGVTAEHLSTLANKLELRYEVFPNAPGARRCLEVAMGILQCAVDEDGDLPEVGAEGYDNWIDQRIKYLTNLRRLRGYWVRRFGDQGIEEAGHGEKEAERRILERRSTGIKVSKEEGWATKLGPVGHAMYLRSAAMQRLHAFTHGSSRDRARDGEEEDSRHDNWQKRKTKLGEIDEAIRLMQKALDIARTLPLGTVTDLPSIHKPPNLAAYTRDFRRLLVAKLQLHIDEGEVFGAEGLTEVQKIAEEELKKNGNQRVVQVDPVARTVSMGTAASVLFMLYRAEPDERVQYLDQAIRRGKDVLDLAKTHASNADGTKWGVAVETDARNALSMFYRAEYERTGDLRALETAAKHTRKSLKNQLFSQPLHRNRSKKLVVNLRFPTLDTHFDYLRDVNTLAAIFAQRFRKTGEFSELQNAITYQRQIVALAAPDRIVKAGYQVTLSNYLEQLYESQRLQTRAQQEEALESAVGYVQMAWQVLEKSAEMEMKVACLGALSSVHKARYNLDRVKYAGDLEAGRGYIKYAMEQNEKAGLHISKAGLARLLTTFSEILGLFGDTIRQKEAVFIAVLAMQWCPPTLAYELAELNYRMGVEMSKIPDDYSELDTILGPLKKCLREPAASPATRLKAALKLCNLLKDASRWDDVYNIATEAISLFSLVVLRSLPQADQQKCLEAFSGFGSLAAAAALEAKKDPEEALMLLEKGRDIIAGNRFDTRIDLTELRRVDKDLAEEFEKVRAQLDPSGVYAHMVNTGRPGQPGAKDPSGRLLRANRRLEELVDKIRSKKGFEDFLQPLSLEQMKDAAGDGAIVVINIAEWRCDAMIVRKGQKVEPLHLDRLSQSVITQWLGDAPPASNEIGLGISDYPGLLAFLWQSIGYPVLEKLGYTADLSEDTRLEEYPRVWWCSTGNASRLPIHAASSGRKPGIPRGNVINRVVSSYTSSIKALIFSRRQASRRRAAPHRGSRALLCSVLSTLRDKEWGLTKLVGAPEEVEAIAETITETMSGEALTQCAPQEETNMVKLNVKIESDPYQADLLDYFTLTSLTHSPPPPEEWPAIFHFAGHGVSNPADPSQSCLYTKDLPLYVEDLVRVGLYERAPLLAYLSACSTGVNLVNGKTGLGDEGIHVMGALQLAGFVGVVGALWRVSDATAGRVARVFYEKWLNSKGDLEEEGKMARCLHYAILDMKTTRDRDRLADRQPSHWAPFMHMGV